MNNSKKTNLYLTFGVLLVLLLVLSFSANLRFIFMSRASSSGGNFSTENSYTFISPLEALANSTDKIRLTVILLNAEGRGVPNVEVTLDRSPEVVIEQVQPRTDSYGRAFFDLFTSKSGDYFVTASVAGRKVGESMTVRFK